MVEAVGKLNPSFLLNVVMNASGKIGWAVAGERKQGGQGRITMLVVYSMREADWDEQRSRANSWGGKKREIPASASCNSFAVGCNVRDMRHAGRFVHLRGELPFRKDIPERQRKGSGGDTAT